MRYHELLENDALINIGGSDKDALEQLKHDITTLSREIDISYLDDRKLVRLANKVIQLVVKLKRFDRDGGKTSDLDRASTSLEQFTQQAEHRLKDQSASLPDGDLVTFKATIKKTIGELIGVVASLSLGNDADPKNNRQAAGKIQNLAIASMKKTNDPEIKGNQVKIAKTAANIQ